MSNITITIDQKVMLIELQRLEKKNAITREMYTELYQGLKEASESDAIKNVVFMGSDECFSAGNDLKDFLQTGQLDSDHPTVQFLSILTEFKKPVLAAVAGPAIGIGTTILLHCDYIVAAPMTQFQLPFTQLGLCPEAASSFILPYIVGYQKAAELLLFGEAFDAATAEKIGLINKIVDNKVLKETVLERAHTLARLPTQSVLESKRLIKSHFQKNIQNALTEELHTFYNLLKSEECQNIVQQFFTHKK